MVLLAGCNAVSLQNTSNDHKWKNKKFEEIHYLKLIYNPVVVNKITSQEPVFFNRKDTVRPDLTYQVKRILENKFQKRNIVFIDTGKIILTIDTLIFQEYAESKSVYSNDEVEYLAVSEQDFFKFKIVGTIKSDTKTETISVTKEHNTDPRESYTIPGVIVKDGINADAKKMIENTINEFSYKTFERLKINYN